MWFDIDPNDDSVDDVRSRCCQVDDDAAAGRPTSAAVVANKPTRQSTAAMGRRVEVGQ